MQGTRTESSPKGERFIKRGHSAEQSSALANSGAIGVTLEREPEAIAEEWDQLADRLDTLPFLRPGWILPWSRAFAPGRLAVLTAREGTEFVGAFPFIKRPFAMSSPTNWHTPAFGYLAASDAVSQAMAQRFLALAHVCADLSFLDAADPNLDVCQAVAAQAGRRVIVRTIELSPYVEITARSWEQYRTTLSRKLVKDLERRERRLAEVGELKLDVLDGRKEFDRMLAEGLRIEGSGWKEEQGTAIRSDPATKQFYTDVGRWAAERGWLELAFLRLDGKAIAFDLCVRTDRAIHVLKGGFDPAYRRFGPGSLLTYESLRRAFEQGVATYELLGDDDPYKRIWTSSVRQRMRFQAFTSSPAGTISYVGWSWGRKAALGLGRGSRSAELEQATRRSTARHVRDESDRGVSSGEPMTPEQTVLEDRSRRRVEASRAEAKTTAGFFSSARTLTLPLGSALDPKRVRGYPIDLTVKAQAPRWPPPFQADASYVVLAQYGLGCYERFLAGDGGVWLETALSVGRYLVDKQELDGSWLNQRSFPHTFPLVAPWRCGMAQGEGASLLVRLYHEVGEPSFAAAAQKALAPLYVSREQGGVCARLHGAPWPEEYPTDPPSFVLNGAMFAWWGIRDVAVGLGDDAAARAFQEGVDALAANLHRFDTGSWSLYCLARFPVAPIASSFYHVLHITQLEAMHALAPRPEFELTRQRWLSYLDSRWLRAQALSRKVLYRLVVPRNRWMAHRLPWARPLRPKTASQAG